MKNKIGPEEAINILKGIENNLSIQERKALKVAYDALNKQIPVIPIKNPYTSGSMYRSCGLCGRSHDLTRLTHKYCEQCGTRIEWKKRRK